MNTPLTAAERLLLASRGNTHAPIAAAPVSGAVVPAAVEHAIVDGDRDEMTTLTFLVRTSNSASDQVLAGVFGHVADGRFVPDDLLRSIYLLDMMAETPGQLPSPEASPEQPSDNYLHLTVRSADAPAIKATLINQLRTRWAEAYKNMGKSYSGVTHQTLLVEAGRVERQAERMLQTLAVPKIGEVVQLQIRNVYGDEVYADDDDSDADDWGATVEGMRLTPGKAWQQGVIAAIEAANDQDAAPAESQPRPSIESNDASLRYAQGVVRVRMPIFSCDQEQGVRCAQAVRAVNAAMRHGVNPEFLSADISWTQSPVATDASEALVDGEGGESSAAPAP